MPTLEDTLIYRCILTAIQHVFVPFWHTYKQRRSTLIQLLEYTEQDRKCTHNVTLWHVCVTIVAIETQQYVPFLFIFWCRCSFRQYERIQSCHGNAKRVVMYVWCNTEAQGYHCYRGKAISITYFCVCVCGGGECRCRCAYGSVCPWARGCVRAFARLRARVALLILHAKHMHHIIFVASLVPPHRHFLINGTIFWKKVTEHKMSDFTYKLYPKCFSF
jgi:hypothetical protein